MVFKAHFLNVGCADCTIFEMGDDVVLIDCGYHRFSNDVSKPGRDLLIFLRDINANWFSFQNAAKNQLAMVLNMVEAL